MRRSLLRTCSAIALATGLFAGTARADEVITYIADWGSGAVTGTVTIDVTDSTVLSYAIVDGGVNTYGSGDYNSFTVNFDGGLPNYYGELIGQTDGNTNVWAEGNGEGGLFLNSNDSAPGTYLGDGFQIYSNYGEGSYTLDSLAFVPEPMSAAALAVGLAGLVPLRRLRRKKVTA